MTLKLSLILIHLRAKSHEAVIRLFDTAPVEREAWLLTILLIPDQTTIVIGPKLHPLSSCQVAWECLTWLDLILNLPT